VHLKKLFEDICPYLKETTQTLLSYLIFEKGEINLQAYMDSISENHGQMISDQILRIEAVFEEDSYLMGWQKNFQNLIDEDAAKIYEKFLIKKADIKHNVDWDAVAESKKAY
jgi:hypothetical protein